jgi:lipopolysaccharide cholinephosphotransferase
MQQLTKFFPAFLLNYLQKLSYKGVTLWKDKRTKYVSNIYGVSGDKEKVPAEFYGTARYVPFEDTVMPIPEKAEEYNTQIYGNFMEYPPEEQRVPSHFKDF